MFPQKVVTLFLTIAGMQFVCLSNSVEAALIGSDQELALQLDIIVLTANSGASATDKDQSEPTAAERFSSLFGSQQNSASTSPGVSPQTGSAGLIGLVNEQMKLRLLAEECEIEIASENLGNLPNFPPWVRPPIS